MNRSPRHRFGAALAGAGLLIGLFTVLAPAARADHGGAHVDGPKTANNELNRCNGVINGGSGNTGKELITADSNLEPGGTAVYRLTFPAGENETASLAVVDCMLRNGVAYSIYDITQIPLTVVNGVGSFTVTFSAAIPANAQDGDEICNIAQTTGGTGAAPSSVRKTNMPCFTITDDTQTGGGDPPGGRLEVSKVVTDELEDDGDLTFRFNVACTGDGPAANFNNEAVSVDEPWTSPADDLLPAGYVCSVTERTNEGQLPDAGEDAEWATPTYSAAQVTIVADETAEVTITNARVATGGGDTFGDLWISKTSVGEVGTFTFDVDCSDGDTPTHDPQNVEVVTTQDGVAATVEARTGIPTGTSCTVTEDTPADESWELTAAPSGPVVIAEGDDNVAAFTNTYDDGGDDNGVTPVVGGGATTGPLVIAKAVEGVPAEELGAYTFTFSVNCAGTDFDGTTQITGEGSVTYHAALPAGTTCEVAETAIAPASDSEGWTTSITDSDGGALGSVTILDAGGETVSFVNRRSVVAGEAVTPPPAPAQVPAPADTPAPAAAPAPEVQAGTELARTAALARTGIDTGMLLLVAGLFLLLGATLWSWAEIGDRRAVDLSV